MNEFDLEDAVSAAMLDLFDYWVNLKSSISDDPHRNFAYAVTRGTWKAKSVLGDRASEIETTSSLDELEYMMSDGEDKIGELASEPFADYTSDRVPRYQAPSAEDVLFDHFLHDDILNAINNLDGRDFDGWFSDFWSGDSLVDIAKRENVTPDTIRMRRNRGLDRLAASDF